ncbi:hypothetical protein CC2G_008097 [Coprinopsis cinerea AmutBmut pab1-1]|nr:hypothetical protein CC2G_008097 [Coprinopsis cinerea AmutBmut pab1-1]
MTSLPPNVLQRTFKMAATRDHRTALRLTLVCREAREWVEPILYSAVKLSNEASVEILLNTMITSNKPQWFYADHVRSLVITQKAHIPSLIQILLACPRISHLTFWSIPEHGSPSSRSTVLLQSSPSGSGPRLYLSNRQAATPMPVCHYDFPDDCFETIRPRFLTVSFRRHGLPQVISNPDFQRGFFAQVTHFSVLNSFEEWATWNHIHQLPSLTHLALDFNVAKARGLHYQHHVRQIAKCIQAILRKCLRLQALVILLLFDDQPQWTASEVIEAIKEAEEAESTVFPFHNPVRVVDPRLVWARKTNPFAGREAHSDSEQNMWCAAEHQVQSQLQPSMAEVEGGPRVLEV